jgi:restriction system protein
MPVLQFDKYINPLLSALKRLGGSARPSEACALIARDLGLTDSDLDERLANGVSRFENRVHWARFYLVKSGFIDSSKRGVWSLTEKGLSTPTLDPAGINELIRTVQELDRGGAPPEMGGRELPRTSEIETTLLPAAIEEGYRERLLAILKSLPPSGFERLCQRLLREEGFEQVVVTGRSGDGGIDGHGILQLNPFVSFRVLFQCKRYEGAVSSSQIRDFRGAMSGRADKGIVLTTGSFSADAKREANRDGAPHIELVDGEKLLDLCEKLEFGLKQRATYEIDLPFFDSFKD